MDLDHQDTDSAVSEYTHRNRTAHTGLSKGESSRELDAILDRDTECLEKLFQGHEAKEKE
jgi:hypothetical protein